MNLEAFEKVFRSLERKFHVRCTVTSIYPTTKESLIRPDHSSDDANEVSCPATHHVQENTGSCMSREPVHQSEESDGIIWQSRRLLEVQSTLHNVILAGEPKDVASFREELKE